MNETSEKAEQNGYQCKKKKKNSNVKRTNFAAEKKVKGKKGIIW